MNTPANGDKGIPSAPIGVIDIGSNSVRMVVYEGERRSPHILFNEKVLCGLGEDLSATGALSKDGLDMAYETLARFAHLAQDMDLRHLDVVATSAVRDASDGSRFMDQVKQNTGLDIRLLSGEEEALYTAEGVLSGTPEAEGIVGDLGGGSLELAHVKKGKVKRTRTLPIGAVRLLGDDSLTPKKRLKLIENELSQVNWLAKGEGKELYLVGGAWRALARIDMQRRNHPIPVVHHYIMTPKTIAESLKWAKDISGEVVNIAARRLPTLPIAAEILEAVMEHSGAKHAVISAMGLREGLLFHRLSKKVQKKDPFIDACEEMARRLSRFPEHGDILMDWLDPLFNGSENAEDRRIRHGVCLTSDIGWRAHPDYRAESAMYASLYGWFVGVDARARAMMGVALFTCYGGSVSHELAASALSVLDKSDQTRAMAIGRALRLAQRLSGGTASPLQKCRLLMQGDRLILKVLRRDAPMLGEVVVKRLSALAITLDVPYGILVCDEL